ncbi:MAG: tetratricopeptide repeat protein [Spirochaetaceae bacterium]
MGVRIIRLFLSSAIALLLLSGCDRRDSRRDALEFLQRTEATRYEGQEVSQERMRELQQEIETYEEDVEEVVRKLSDVGVFRKLLAEEFLDREMYGPALEHLQAAMELQPANAVLFYLAGVSSAQTGKAYVEDRGRREEHLRLAEEYYLRALELDSRYRECLYAISVLYVFELQEPGEAREYMDRLLEIDPGNTQARFLKARMLVELGNIEEAADLYGEIAEEAPTREQRDRAMANRNQLLEGRN